jgi:phosphoribosylglycinamide formyltransferase 1
MSYPLRLGIIGSSGGGALISASDCLRSAGTAIEWIVVTDRECGLATWAKKNARLAHRIPYINAEYFSENANKVFRNAGCEDVLLFYTRRVAKPLIDQRRVWNIHPSLLPSFPGLNGVKDAISAGVKVIGATLHHVDAGLDTGKIVAQVASPFSAQLNLEQAQHLSYLQKVWLTLAWVDQLATQNNNIETDVIAIEVAAASPGIIDEKLRLSYVEFLAKNKRYTFV